MRCLFCNKPINSEGSINGWHKSCIKKFFNSEDLPTIHIEDEIASLAKERKSVAGVQKKLSIYINPIVAKKQLYSISQLVI